MRHIAKQQQTLGIAARHRRDSYSVMRSIALIRIWRSTLRFLHCGIRQVAAGQVHSQALRRFAGAIGCLSFGHTQEDYFCCWTLEELLLVVEFVWILVSPPKVGSVTPFCCVE